MNQPITHSTPLCVDLDGTLLRTDMLFESLLLAIKQNPLVLLWLPFWLFKGRAWLKHELAQRIQFDPAALPYHQPLLHFLQQQHQQGRELYLATASDRAIAAPIAAHVGLFTEVIASAAADNLKGRAKAQHLVARFGERGYSYAGDNRADLAVWQHAASAVLVNVRPAVAAQVTVPIEQQFAPDKPWWRLVPKVARMYQWVKNLLIFVPLVAAHEVDNLAMFGQSVLAFLAFSLVASSAYIWNDLLDLEADRHHTRKKNRPFASGQVPIPIGVALSLVALALAFGLAWALLPALFVLVLAGYYALTIAYSFWLKRVVLVDVFCLALLYTLRVIAGVAALAQVELSYWLLAFSVFFFLCLAFVKRHSELLAARRQNQHQPKGRGYVADDLEILANLGVASGFTAVLVLALYINSPQVRELYTEPDFLWLICLLLLYWLSRTWLISHRGLMHDDPIVFAIRDRVSHLTVLLMTLAGALATFWRWPWL